MCTLAWGGCRHVRPVVFPVVIALLLMMILLRIILGLLLGRENVGHARDDGVGMDFDGKDNR